MSILAPASILAVGCVIGAWLSWTRFPPPPNDQLRASGRQLIWRLTVLAGFGAAACLLLAVYGFDNSVIALDHPKMSINGAALGWVGTTLAAFLGSLFGAGLASGLRWRRSADS